MNNILFYKIQKFVRTKIKNVYWPIYCKLKKKELALNSMDKREKKIIVSLTSIPSRFPKLILSIESIMNQSLKPDKIILFLDHQNKGIEKTEEFNNLVKRGLEIKFCFDLCCHTKYFYAYQEYPKDIIITIDDDILYHKHLIKQLMESYQKFPEAISAMRVHNIIFDNEGNVFPYNCWEYEYTKEKEPSYKLIATGVGGVLYPPGSLGKECFDEEKIKKICFKADDIWLKFMQLINNRKVVKVPRIWEGLVVLQGTQEQALAKQNVDNNRNDLYIKNMESEYGKISLIMNQQLKKIN